MNRSTLELPLLRKHLPKKDHLLFPMTDSVYVVPSPNRSNWAESLSASDSIILGLLFSGIYVYLEKKDTQLLAEYHRAFQSNDSATLLRKSGSFVVPYSSVQRIHVDARKQAITTDWDQGGFTIHVENQAPIVFAFPIYSKTQSIKDFVTEHFADIELEWIE